MTFRIKTSILLRSLARIAAFAALTGLLVSAPAFAQDAAEDMTLAPSTVVEAPAEIGQASVLGLRILNNDERARLIVDLSATTEFAIASLSGPDRIVVDLKTGAIEEPIVSTDAGTGIISSYAIALAEEGRVRATLTLSLPAQVQQAYLVEAVDEQPARLIVDLIPDSPARFAERVSDDYKAALARQAAADAVAKASVPPDLPQIPSTDSAVVRNDAPKPLVVIDPGHGGVDGGAEATSGVREKDVVLSFALELQRLLVDTGRFEVAMTRDDDRFVRLEDRVQVARANKADLFLSIHADKFEDPAIRGTALYMRDATATSELHKILADNENRVDLIAGFAPPDSDERVTSILVELMQRDTRRKSFRAAQAILAGLESHTRLRRIPLHRANFFVLQAPEVPALLLEIGFLSNDEDVANLTREDWRDETANAIAAGVVAYFDGLAQN